MNGVIKRTNEESATPIEVERALIGGDLSGLPPEQRIVLYKKVCDSLGLNYLTSPFAYIKTKDGKIKLYALKDCAEQLRKINRVSISSLEVVNNSNGIYAVRATGVDKDGRTDSSLGAVAAGHLKGEDLANAMMKAETKAKRRLALSISGLGMLDESELDGMRGSRVVSVQEAHSAMEVTGELIGSPEPEAPPPPKKASERYFRFQSLAEEQLEFLSAIGEFREDVRAWVFPSTAPLNFFKKIAANEVSADLIEAEMLQEAAAAASGVGEISIEPKKVEAPLETPLQKAQKRAASMQSEHVSGALAKLNELKQKTAGGN
jgi:hypothetical protein